MSDEKDGNDEVAAEAEEGAATEAEESTATEDKPLTKAQKLEARAARLRERELERAAQREARQPAQSDTRWGRPVRDWWIAAIVAAALFVVSVAVDVPYIVGLHSKRDWLQTLQHNRETAL